MVNRLVPFRKMRACCSPFWALLSAILPSILLSLTTASTIFLESSSSSSAFTLVTYSQDNLRTLFHHLNHKFHENNHNSQQISDDNTIILTLLLPNLLTNENILEIGQEIDNFITPRPWWIILNEPYVWKQNEETLINNEIQLQYVGKKYSTLLQDFATVQFPKDCQQYPLRIGLTGGFDSFGNNFYNYDITHSAYRYSVIVPYIVDHDASTTSFLSKGSCPDLDNKFECAFLAPTTCKLPPIEKILQNQTFSTATYDARPMRQKDFENLQHHLSDKSKLSNSQLNDLNLPLFHHLQPSPYHVYYDLFNSDKPQSTTRQYDPNSALFTYGILFRINYNFRTQIYHEIHELKKTFKVPFPSDGNCIAIHIRRNRDRAPYHIRGSKILEWCEKYKVRSDGTCYDDETNSYIAKGDCIHYWDYGCSTRNPYGYLTLENYLNATDLISKDIKNILLRTDDDQYIHQELLQYKGSKQIYYYPAHHNHRTASTSSGISYLSAIELAKECKYGFIGHSGSAVTNLWMSNLCIRHYGNYATCPTFFDFGS